MTRIERLQARAAAKLDRLTEIRDMDVEKVTDEIRTEMKQITTDLEQIRSDIETERRAASIDDHFSETPEPRTGRTPIDEDNRSRIEVGTDLAGKKPWMDFGEQMRAIRYACTPGGPVDIRLAPEARAASGLNEGIASDGGFLVDQDFSKELIRQMYEVGVIANRCRRIPIGANSNGLKMNGIDESSRADGSRWGGVRAYWEGEADTATATKPRFRQMTWTLKKLLAFCYTTDELLEDTTALGAILTEAFAEEMAFKLDDAIYNGDGVGKPLGIMSSPALIPVAKEAGQAATTLVYENIVKMWSRMWARSRANAVWFVNQDIEPQLHSMTLAVGTGGVPVYMPAGGLSQSPYSQLFGRPVIPVEHAATLGTVGDIVLADMSQYLLVDKGGLKQDYSIHVRFLYGEGTYRFVLRVDGQPLWMVAKTPFKGSNTQSPLIALATR
jgi:HK97 family phage major capsid protein